MDMKIDRYINRMVNSGVSKAETIRQVNLVFGTTVTLAEVNRACSVHSGNVAKVNCDDAVDAIDMLKREEKVVPLDVEIKKIINKFYSGNPKDFSE